MKYKAYLIISVILIVLSCSKDSNSNSLDIGYRINGNTILVDNSVKQFVGANALHSFGAGSSDMPTWNLNIAREFVGNISENPIDGFPIQDSNGQFLHSLQFIVNDNRSNGLVTILCPFGWNGQNETLFTGKFPTATEYWDAFKLKLAEWSEYFKDQDDVWIEVWNEPYRFDRSDGYTDTIWSNTMTELYNVVRTTGNNNIVLIPCAEQGQDESVLNNIGQTFLANKGNVLFDIHAYEKWLLVDEATISNRVQTLISNNLPVFFGEVAPVNAGVLMNPESFLNIIHDNQLSYAAWLWKYDETDQDALLTTQGLPNDVNNNNWGTLFRSFGFRPRL